MLISMDECERRVEAMEAKAAEMLAEVESLFRISHVLGAFSGGNDSIVSTHWAMESKPDALVMVASTQIALPPSVRHITDTIHKLRWAADIQSPSVEGPPKGWVGEWVDGQTSYEEYVLNFGFPGHCQHPRMYQRLKQRAFRKVKANLGSRPRGSRVLVVSGIRHDESAIRAGYRRAWQEEPTECFVWFNPFYWSTALDFEAYRQWYGLPRNPVKDKAGISGECCCGSHAVPGELDAYAVISPDFDRYLTNLRKRVMERFPWDWESGPPKWWIDAKKGQQFLFPPEPQFMPACIGCSRKPQVVWAPRQLEES